MFENIRIFCFNCGKFGHRLSDCKEHNGTKLSEEQEENLIEEENNSMVPGCVWVGRGRRRVISKIYIPTRLKSLPMLFSKVMLDNLGLLSLNIMKMALQADCPTHS